MNCILLSGPNGDVLTIPLAGLDTDPKGQLSVKGFPNLPAVTYPSDDLAGLLSQKGWSSPKMDLFGSQMNVDHIYAI